MLSNTGNWAKDDGDYYGLDLTLSWPPRLSNKLNLQAHFEHWARVSALSQSQRISPWVSPCI